MTFMGNWITVLAYAGGIVTVVVLAGCIYLLKTAIIELHTTCDEDYEWYN